MTNPTRPLGRTVAFLALAALLAACGTATPGDDAAARENVGAQQLADVRISEIRIDQPGDDLDEYVELAGTAGTSLDGATYLVIGDGAGGSGEVEAVVDLSGAAIPASGFFVAAESSFTLGSADLVTDLNFENSDNVTHLLVTGFTGANGQDLDTDDDGTLDATPWSQIVDAVALIESVGSGEQTYASTTVGPDGTFVPAHVYLCDEGFRIGAFGSLDDDTPGAANPCEPTEPPADFGQCGDPATLISAVQGAGDVSPLEGDLVVIEGVIVGDFQDGDGDPFDTDLGGFFVQEEDADADADPATSEGVFVYAPGAADVEVGDTLRLEGTVEEFFGLTQLSGVTLLPCAATSALPTPATITFPLTSPADLEAFEGMAIALPQTLFISEFFNFDRFGEIVLAAPIAPFDRHFQPTSYVEPGAPAQAVLDEIALNRITLDDGRSNQNPDPARHPNGSEFTLDNRFRGGDTVQNVTGVLSYGFSLYRVHPTGPADYVAANPRPAAPSDVGGTITVATLNVLNYFSTLDTGADICGPDGDLECRGADDATEFERQRDKIFAALAGLDADVVGLVEIENGADALADLVAGLNDLVGAGTYAAIETGPIGSDAIRVALIYKAATVDPVGSYAVLDTPAFLDPNGLGDDKNRPAVAQTFQPAGGGDAVTVVVNHFKSKGSPCGPGDDDPYQGSCNLTRTLAAQELLDWLATDPTGTAEADVLLIGDYNAYDEEDPIDVLTGAGYADLLEDADGEDAYTYVFDGQLGHLDYVFASADLTGKISGATAWAINADEPDILDYDTSFKQDAQDALYEANAYRSSDHDPVMAGLDLNRAPTCGAAVAAIPELWPPNHKLVSNEILGVTDPDGDAVALTIDGILQDEPVDARGDGRTEPDAVIGDGAAFEVRAERSGRGDGRVYHVIFTATDGVNPCSGVVKVAVPHDRRPNGEAVDGGALFDATAD